MILRARAGARVRARIKKNSGHGHGHRHRHGTLLVHVCLDVRMIHSGGIGTYIKNLLKLFSQEGFQLTLLHFEKDRALFQNIPKTSLRALKSPIYSAREQWEVAQSIPKCDIYFSPHFNLTLLPTKAKRTFCTIHDAYHLAYFSSLALAEKLYAKILYNGAMLKSDEVITVSEFSKAELIKLCRVRPKKISVIYNAVEKTESTVTECNVTKPYILFVGNLKPNKNLKRLLEAYETLAFPESLVIVGAKQGHRTSECEAFSFLENRPFLKKRVIFTDRVSDLELKSLYTHASCFVFPSLYEGFGLPPIEAMQAGCPVVASHAASIPEVCKEGALYIDPYDVKDLQKGIERMLQDVSLRAKVIAAGNQVAYSYPFELFKQRHLKLIYG